MITSCSALRALGAEVIAVLCVIDRESGASANMAAEGLELRSLFTMSELREAVAA